MSTVSPSILKREDMSPLISTSPATPPMSPNLAVALYFIMSPLVLEMDPPTQNRFWSILGSISNPSGRGVSCF